MQKKKFNRLAPPFLLFFFTSDSPCVIPPSIPPFATFRLFNRRSFSSTSTVFQMSNFNMLSAFVTSTNALTSGLFHASPTPLTPRTTATPPHTPHVTLPRITMSARKFLVGGNWKCNLSKSTISNLVSEFNNGPAFDKDQVEVVISPPAVYLETTRSQLRDDFATAAQNVWIGAGGAFTGEIDAAMVRDVGAEWTILGHSERRHHAVIRELDSTIAEKAAYVTCQIGLKVIYCIGELLEEREKGKTVEVVERQLLALKKRISDWSKVVLAYEPVWAIGTGKVATPEQAEAVHLAIREWLEREVGREVAEGMRILYGGSVNAGNCGDLAKQKNIDGFLVGGASMKKSFLEIVDSYKTAVRATV